MKPKLAIIIDGGLVHVVTDHPELRDSIDLFIVDYDTDGGEEEDTVELRQTDGSFERCFIRPEWIEESTIDLEEVAAKITE